MIEVESSKLSAEEVGAFAAQWAEQRSVGLAELSAKLGVDETQAASLMRQARGRLAMGKWVAERQPKASNSFSGRWPLAAALAVGVAFGGFVTSYFWPAGPQGTVAAHPLPHPDVQVTTTDPPQMQVSGHRMMLPPGKSPSAVQGQPVSVPQGTHPGAVWGGTPGQPMSMPPTGRMIAPPSGYVETRAGGKGPGAFGRGGAPLGSVQGGGPVTRPEDGFKPRQDVTHEVNVQIPRDVAILMITPTKVYAVRGPITKHYQNAEALGVSDFKAPIEAFLKYMEERGYDQDGPKGPTGSLKVALGVGRAHAECSIAWRKTSPDGLSHMPQISASQFERDLCGPVMSQIKQYGTKLFSPAMIPMVIHATGVMQ